MSVLFVDLVGFTERSERSDVEEIADVLGAYFGRVREALVSSGGTVEKFIGDAVVAVFGVPVSHEDDAERAVRAALRVVEELSDLNDEDQALALHVRAAVATGEVLATMNAGPGEAIVTGDLVNTCARLQAAAPHDAVLVTASTRAQTERVIRYEPHEAVHAKGKQHPIECWRALEPVARVGDEIVLADRTPLVGRDRELGILIDAFDQTVATARPHLVTLVGAAGIGKSRLVRELSHHVGSLPELVFWRKGTSASWGQEAPFRALSEIVRAHAGILEGDDVATTEARLAKVIGATLASEPEQASMLEALRPLAGLAGREEQRDREQDRAVLFAAWRGFFETLAEESPLVLVFEDLHWADDATLDFLDHLTTSVTDVPLLVVGTARPELLDRRPAWAGGTRNAYCLQLDPLREPDTRRLLGALTQDSPVDADLLAGIGGNPLFAEEFVRFRQERGGDHEVPASLQALIGARLDLLSADEGSLTMDAAVVGTSFWPGALHALGQHTDLAECLRLLERHDVIRRVRRSSVAGQPEYTFRHNLIRDVAYARLPRRERAPRHLTVARWGEETRLVDDATIAHHYDRALGYEPDVDVDVQERAANAFMRAGALAQAQADVTIAAHQFRRAVECTATGSAAYVARLQQAAIAHRFVDGDLTLTFAYQARAATDEQTQPLAAARSEAIIANALRWRDAPVAERLPHIEEALAFSAGDPASIDAVHIASHMSYDLAIAGQKHRAIGIAEEAARVAEQLGDRHPRYVAWAYLTYCLIEADELERAVETNRRAEAFADGPLELAEVLQCAFDAHVGVGDLEGAGACLVRREAVPNAHPGASDQMAAQLAFAAGRLGEVHARLAGRAGWTPEDVVLAELLLGATAIVEGDLQAGRVIASRQIDADDPAFRAVARLVHMVATAQLDPRADPSPEYLLRPLALALLDDLDHRDPQLWDAWSLPGRWRDAATAMRERRYRDAATIYEQIGHRLAEADARIRHARQLLDADQPERARAELDRADAICRPCGAHGILARADQQRARLPREVPTPAEGT